MSVPELGKAYLFWLPSLAGIAGLHRFYLGKPLSGLLYLITGGLFGIGTIYDALTMPQLVRTAQLQTRLADMLNQDGRVNVHVYSGNEWESNRRTPPPNSVEYSILNLAKRNGGVVTPSQVAIEARIEATEAREALEKLVKQGFAEIQVTKVGVMVYAFPEFLTEDARANLETF